MIDLELVSGARRGYRQTVAEFPFIIGRAKSSGLVLDDSGVWDNHLEISLSPHHEILLKTFPNAFSRRNGMAFTEGKIRNGDMVDIGSCRIHFSLSPVQQRALGLREKLTWLLPVLISLLQLGLVCWLWQG